MEKSVEVAARDLKSLVERLIYLEVEHGAEMLIRMQPGVVKLDEAHERLQAMRRARLSAAEAVEFRYRNLLLAIENGDGVGEAIAGLQV